MIDKNILVIPANIQNSTRVITNNPTWRYIGTRGSNHASDSNDNVSVNWQNRMKVKYSNFGLLRKVWIISIMFLLLSSLNIERTTLPPISKDETTLTGYPVYSKTGTRGDNGTPEGNFTTLRRHIRTFINGGSSDEFLGQHFDLIMDFAWDFLDTKYLNPGSINLLYDYLGTMVVGDSDRKYHALLEYCDLHGLTSNDIENMFLHAKEDVNFTLEGETRLVPGWNPINDINDDGYVNDTEFENRINSSASARIRNESRIPIYYWDPLGDFLMNIDDSNYSNFIINDYFPTLLLDNEKYDDPLFWKTTNPIRVVDDHFEGAHSSLIEVDEGNKNLINNQYVELEPNTIYTIGVMIKTKNFIGNVKIYEYEFQDSERIVGNIQVSNFTSDWQFNYLQFKINNDVDGRITITFSGGPGKVWIDEVLLVKGKYNNYIGLVSQQNILKNGGFEEIQPARFDGIFLDTLHTYPTVQNDTKILEYPVISNYSEDIKTLLSGLKNALPDNAIIIGNNWDSDPIIISGSEYESWASITKSINSAKLDSITNRDKKEIIQLIQYNPPDFFIGDLSLERDQMYSLSLYYLVHGNHTYYGYGGGKGVYGSYDLDKEKWFNAINYDIGQPLSSYYFFNAITNETQNILNNGNFDIDEDKDDNPDYWEISEPTELDPIVKHEGNYSSKIESNVRIDNINKQYVTLEPNTNYTLSGWIKTEKLIDICASIYPYEFDDLQKSDPWIEVRGTSDWTFYNMIFMTGSDIEGRINYRVKGNGTSWYDDIHLTKGIYHTVFARDFQNATVLLKTQYSVGDNTTTSFSLDGNYSLLKADGTLDTPINNIELMCGEGVILIRENLNIPPKNTLNVTGINLAPINVLQCDIDVEMAKLRLSASSGSVEVTDIRLDLSGTGSDTDVDAVKLYEDIDNSSTLTPSDIQIGTTQTFSGGTLTFSNLLLNVSSETPVYLLIVYDISETAIGGNSIGCRIENNSYISVLGQDIANPFAAISSINSTILTDIIPPTVVSIEFSENSPLKVGSIDITVIFSEEMDTTINPTITFGQTSPFTTNTIIQYSFIGNIWIGTLVIDSATGDGIYRIMVGGAEDLEGNPLESVYISDLFEIDTMVPFSSVQSFPEYHNDMNFNVPYNAVDGSGSGIQYVELYYRRDNNDWIKYNDTFTSSPISFIASEEGFYEFYTIATDNADNMEEVPLNADTSTIVDTTLPTIQSIKLSDTSPLKTGNVTLTITFSENMNSTISPIITFGLAFPYDTHVISESLYFGNTWTGTFEINENTGDGTNIINISCAEDLAGNQIIKNTSFTFVIDTRHPNVISTTPNGKYIAINTTISITFNEIMNHTSVQNSFAFTHVTLTRTIFTGSFSWNGNTITFIPHNDLNYGTDYIISIGTYAKDPAENNLVFRYTWSFTTVQSQNNISSRIDYIQIRDESKGKGNVVEELTFTLGENALDILYCTAYNYSLGYIGEADAKWIITSDIGSLSPSTGTFSNFMASNEGTGIISAELSGIINSTGIITVKSAIDPSKLQVPTNVTVKTLSSKEIEIKWSLNNEPNAEGYIIQRSTNSDGPWDNVHTVDKNRDSCIDTDLDYDTTYYYRIIAIDDAGNEATPSQIVSTTTDKTEEFPLFWVLMIIVIIGLLILVFSTLKKDKPKEVSLQLIELKKELPPPSPGWKSNKEELSPNGNNKSVPIDDEIPEEDLPPPDDWIDEDELPPLDDEIPEDELSPPDDWIDEDELPPPDD